MTTDDTTPLPRQHRPDRYEGWLLIWLAVAYLFAGMILGFACVTLADVAQQINATPFCRRI